MVFKKYRNKPELFYQTKPNNYFSTHGYGRDQHITPQCNQAGTL